MVVDRRGRFFGHQSFEDLFKKSDIGCCNLLDGTVKKCREAADVGEHCVERADRSVRAGRRRRRGGAVFFLAPLQRAEDCFDLFRSGCVLRLLVGAGKIVDVFLYVIDFLFDIFDGIFDGLQQIVFVIAAAILLFRFLEPDCEGERVVFVIGLNRIDSHPMRSALDIALVAHH